MKGKFFVMYNMKVYRESGGSAPLILTHGTGLRWLDIFTSQQLYRREAEHPMLGGSQSRYRHFWKREVSCRAGNRNPDSYVLKPQKYDSVFCG
jgi:hypothetical protein